VDSCLLDVDNGVRGDGTSEGTGLDVEQVGDIEGKGSGGIDTRRSESVVSDVTRQLSMGLLVMGRVRKVDNPPLGAGGVCNSAQGSLVVTGDRFVLGRVREDILPQDDRDGRELSRRYETDTGTARSVPQWSRGPADTKQFSTTNVTEHKQNGVDGPLASEWFLTKTVTLCSRTRTRAIRKMVAAYCKLKCNLMSAYDILSIS